MASVRGAKTVGPGFANDPEVVRVRYEFGYDGGAVGVLNLLTASGAMIIKDFHAVVKTACTSGGSAVVDVGVVGGDTDALLDGVAVASLTLNSVHSDPLVEGTPNTKSVPMYLADGGVIAMEIKTAALTAGIIEFVFTVMKL
jgi:hypothetical protein